MSMDRDAVTPLYHRIKEELRASIRRQEYTAGAPFITQRELCERYSVSTTTAVRVLGDLVSEGILVRRRGLGTFVADQPEPGTRSPSTAEGRRPAAASQAGEPQDTTISCIIHGLQGPHGINVVSGIESMCAELGYRMLLRNSYGSPDREAQALREAVDAGVAGVVAYPAQGWAHAAAYADLERHGVPLVLVDRTLPDLATDAVVPDHFAVGYELTQHLIARGHERIATLWSETKTTSVTERLAGHKRSLREHDLPALPALTVLRRYWSEDDGTHPTLLRDLLEGADRPSVLLCANGFVLSAAAQNLMQLGVEIPDQIELAGMDNAGPVEPLPLTTVAAVLPSREMGREAMRLLAERIASGSSHSPRHTVLPITLRTRESAAGYLRAVSTSKATALP
jgi:GntR family transcriptional regulator, arabinose operon transcriptional repressor